MLVKKLLVKIVVLYLLDCQGLTSDIGFLKWIKQIQFFYGDSYQENNLLNQNNCLVIDFPCIF